MTHDEEDFSPLVREQTRRASVFFLPVNQVIALCLGAFVIGALIPITFLEKPQDATSVTLETHTDQAFPNSLETPTDQVFNNLRHSPRTDDAPKIAWLMSFPNSGTSYTLDLVSVASNMSMATNYGWERKGFDNVSIPVIPNTKGPFWLQPRETHPKSVVLTKTHCGGYCHDCRPYKSIETPHSFMMHCARAESTILNEDGELKNERHVYDYNTIDRAVHLIRDPFDNMVSRYHLGLHKLQKKNDTELLERYTDDAAGFDNFCTDKTYDREEHTDNHVDQQVLRLIQDVPCHMDLFRYVQWHNLAFITTQDFLKLQRHVLHYEEYSSNFRGTVQSLLHFLELPNTGAYADFEDGKSYRDYYSDDQVAAMRNATMMLASPLTWKHLERYF